MEDESYLDIGKYSVIGNLETITLVGSNGSIDWFCIPHLESPSVFARILDVNKGGYFSISPTAQFDSHQKYLPKTNVLKTTFQTDRGSQELGLSVLLDSGRYDDDKITLQSGARRRNLELLWLVEKVEPSIQRSV